MTLTTTTPPGDRDAAPDAERQPRALATLQGPWLTAAGIFLATAVALGVALRFWTNSALWLDEALTVDIARLPLHDLHWALREDGAPPLYYALLHFWMGLFGSGNLAVRSLSGVLSVLTLPVAWLAGRRFGRTVAWSALLLVATAPFAVYYATEARMYGLVMFLTACGFLALDRALRAPRPGNMIAVVVCSAGLLYSQYWAVYLMIVVALWLAFQAWRGREAWRRNARFALGAVVVGGILFIPWLPTFLFQSEHTGTPWAAPPNFAAVINAITGFTDNQATLTTAGSNQGRLLAIFYFVLAGLALFGLARDRFHVVLDLRTRPQGRALAWITAGTLALAVTGGILTGSAFSPRYAAVVFIPLMLLVAVGTVTLAAPKLRAAILVIAAVAGLAASVENIYTQRTQAPAVASALAANARPGDVVAFCPDQLGPSVARLVPAGRYRTTTFPRGHRPDLVDWIDYSQAIQRVSPVTFAQHLEQEAGSHKIFVVWDSGYQGFGTKCSTLVTALSQGAHVKQLVAADTEKYYEPMYLWQITRTG